MHGSPMFFVNDEKPIPLVRIRSDVLGQRHLFWDFVVHLAYTVSSGLYSPGPEQRGPIAMRLRPGTQPRGRVTATR